MEVFGCKQENNVREMGCDKYFMLTLGGRRER
jgi:hypothetical protein